MQIRREKTSFLTVKYLRSCNTWSVNTHKMDVRKMDLQRGPHGSLSEQRLSGVVDVCQAECLFDLGTSSSDPWRKSYLVAGARLQN
jgi:hypothetical protein